MRAQDIMTQEVISIAPHATVEEAAALMIKERISGLPVINGERELVGIVTEGDLLRRAEAGTQPGRPHWLQVLFSRNRLAEEYVRSHSRRIADLMTTDVATAPEDADLRDVVEIMQRRQINRVPIVREGRVVGIVTRANLLYALTVTPTMPVAAEDRAIKQAICAELRDRAWSARQLQISVHQGVVDIWGLITDERQREAMHVAIENVSGVKRIRDHLLWAAAWAL